MSSATATPTPTPVPDPSAIAAMETDARRRIGELEQEEARLALDALSDPQLAAELRDVQSERRAAEDTLRQAELARAEHERRAQQAAAEAEAARKGRELAQARKLAASYREDAAKVDEACAAYCRALKAFADDELDLQATLARGDESFRRPAGSAPTAALVYHMRAVGVPPSMIETQGINPRAMPLVQSLPRQIDE